MTEAQLTTWQPFASVPLPQTQHGLHCYQESNCFSFTQRHHCSLSQMPRAISFYLFMCACLLSCWVVSNSLQLHALQPARLLCPWDFPGQEQWIGLPFPSLGDIPNLGTEPTSPALAGEFFTTAPPEMPLYLFIEPSFRLALAQSFQHLGTQATEHT